MKNLEKLNKRLAAEKVSLQDFEGEADMIESITLDLKATEAKIKGYKRWTERIISRSLTNENILKRYINISKYIDNTKPSYQKNIKVGRMLALVDAYNGDIEKDAFESSSMYMI